MARAWFEKRERGNGRLLHVTRRLVLLIGRRSALILLWPITAYFYTLSRDGRKGLARYYRALLTHKPPRGTVFFHYLTFARTILDRVYLLARRADAPCCEMHGFEAVNDHLRSGQGCVLLGAHLGSFEVARLTAFSRPEVKMQVIMHAEISRKLNDAIAVLHPGAHDTLVSLGAPMALLGVKETLEQGGLVGMMGDRALATEPTYKATFLGQEASFPLAPLRLAAALGAPVFFFAALHRTAVDGSCYYDVVFEALSEPAPGGRGRALWVRELGERYRATLQKYCRIAPDNWFNFYDFWDSPTSNASAVDLRAEPIGVCGGPAVDGTSTPEDAQSHRQS
ncbi:MAG: LpxL/LpxP family acyltransferase [Acidiferrobacter sp.]